MGNKNNRPAPPRAWAGEPHDTWQMDAKERVRLGDGTLVCWLRLADEASGAVLLTVDTFLPGWKPPYELMPVGVSLRARAD